MTDLADWVLAQIADDEAVARKAGQLPGVSWEYSVDPSPPFFLLVSPERVLADCAAKKVRVEQCVAVIADPVLYDYAARMLAEGLLQLEAQPYADRPGWDPAWRIDP